MENELNLSTSKLHIEIGCFENGLMDKALRQRKKQQRELRKNKSFLDIRFSVKILYYL